MASIREAIRDLFEYAFGILADLGLRDENYRQLYNQMKWKVCAFCGVELLDAPGQKERHWITICQSPVTLSGVNFRNLPPMGAKCNSRYKGQQDILWIPKDFAVFAVIRIAVRKFRCLC